MKVLHLTTHLNPGGITVYILRLAKPLRGLDVQIHVASSGGECVSQFHEEGVATSEFAIRTKSELHPKLYLALPRILRLIHEEKIDLLHAHTRVTQILAFWIQKITSIPVVTTCHGFYKKRLGRRLIPAWGNIAIAISPPVEEYLARQFHIPPDRIRMIYNGVDIEGLRDQYSRYQSGYVKAEYGFGTTDPVVGVVARLVKDKGHDYLIRAISSLKNRFIHIRLLIVGHGNERKSLERLVRETNIEDRVVFTGSMQDIAKPLAAMDIFAFPAIWREGFGLSIAEAMACGKPVVVTNIWALNTLIQDGETGLLVEPQSVDALARAIQQLLENPERAKRIGQQGQQMTETHFSIKRMAKEMVQAYEAAIRIQAPSHQKVLTAGESSL